MVPPRARDGCRIAQVLGLLAVLASPAPATITSSRCVGNLPSPLSPGSSCTASDVVFVGLGLGDEIDGCLSTSDTLSIYLGAKVQNTSGFTRYDVGMFVYDYLGSGDPTPDAFGGQQCAVEALRPAYATVGTSTCGPLNLTGGSGPFYNDDGDGCGDVVKGMCGGADVTMKFTSPITVKCIDAIGSGGSAQPDGFLDLPACLTWGSASNQVGPGGTCTDESTVHPGTGSKCNCGVVNTSVPVPRLALSCGCPASVPAGQPAACTVSFTNSVPNCSATVPTTTAERFECGTASYVRFAVGYSAAQGLVAASPAPSETTGGTVGDDAANQRLLWAPRNSTLSGTSLGVIGAGETGSMSYDFLVDASVPAGTVVSQPVTVRWSNVGPAAWSDEVEHTATAACSFTVAAPLPATDLTITDTDGVTTATPGGSVTYTITASNAGASAAPGATVTDPFPATLTCAWTCTGAGGGTCTAGGAGAIADTVDLPVAASVTYTASCAIAASATGTLSNTATVAPPSGVLDTSPGNDSATDSDALAPPPPPPAGAALSATKMATGTFAVGGTVTYTIVIANAGPGAQADDPGDELTDVLPATLALVSASASAGTAVATTATNTVTWNGALAPGSSATVTITATVLPAAAGAQVANQGTLAYDGNGDGTNEASAVTDDPATAVAGDATTFTVAPAPPPPPPTPAIPALAAPTLLALALALVALAVASLRR